MKKILKYLGIFFQKKGHLVVLFTVLLFTPHLAFAVEGATPTQTVQETMIAMVSTFIKVLNMLIWPVLLMIGDLMSSDLIVGPGMEERLLSIWQQIRNLVNISFVLVLLIMAFYNVSGFAKDGNFALKTGLPKLIIGLILVNFTFLGGKIILDVSNIAMNAVFALPEVVDASNNTQDFKKTIADFEKNICTHTDKTTGKARAYDKTIDKDIPAVAGIFCINDADEYQTMINDTLRTKFFTKLSASNAGLIIAVNMGRLADQNYTDLNALTIGDLVVNQLFSIMMFVIFVISYIVLALVLATRVAVLWIALAFSPVMVLFYVIPELKSSAGSAGNVSEQVLTHILAPIKIGIVITIGFMMLDAMNGAIGAGTGAISSATKVSELSGSLLITGIADLQRLLIAIISIVIVWKGIFSAVDGTLAAGIAEKVKGFAEGAGSTILGSIKYAPLVPVQVGKDGAKQEGFSYNQLKDMPQLYLQAFKSNEDSEARKFVASTALGKMLKMDGSTPALKLLADKVAAGTATHEEIRSILTSGSGTNDATPEERGYYAELIRGLVDKYKPTNGEQLLKDLEDANTGEKLGVIIDNIMRNQSTITKWKPGEDTAKLKHGSTPPPAPVVPPPAPTIPAGSKAMSTLRIPTTFTATIPPALHVPNRVTELTNLTNANVATITQTKIDDYLAMPANSALTTIDVTKL